MAFSLHQTTPATSYHRVKLQTPLKMVNVENSDYFFPYFPLPPPHIPPKTPPSNNTPPPPKAAPPHNSPSPPKTPPSSNTPPTPKVAPPHYSPSPPKPMPPKVAPPHQTVTPPPPPFPVPVPAPPPHHSFYPPPPPSAKPPSHSIPPPSPHVRPPPHPIPPLSPPDIVPPPPATPGHHSNTIVIVFVSLGGLFFLAFLSVALFCFIKRKKRTVQKDEIIKVDEHVKVQEAIIPGPHGEQTKVLMVEEDLHIVEDIKKKDLESGSSYTKPSHHHPHDFDVAASSSGSKERYLEHKT